MSTYRYRGAAVLVALHAEHLRLFLETWRAAKASGARLPVVEDPDYASLEALLVHVFRWARTYMIWVCEQLELPGPEFGPVPTPEAVEVEAPRYLEELLDGWQRPLCDVEESRFFRPEFTAPWGVQYSIEAMLEHAVMHPMRHRFQLEELMGKKGAGS